MDITAPIFPNRSGEGVMYNELVNAIASAFPNRTLIHENELLRLSAAQTLTAPGKC